MQTDDFTLLSNADYFRQLTRDIAATSKGDRVAVATMTLNALDPLVHELLHAMCAAASRGVRVYLAVDARTFLVSADNAPGPLTYSTDLERTLPEPYRSHMEALHALQKAGGHSAITNLPRHAFSQAAAGRSHLKTAVVNDKIYVGGCNLQSSSMLDVMVACVHTQLAAQLYEMVSALVATGSTREVFHGKDRALTLDDRSTVYIDAGTRGQSLILDTAFQLIDAAREHIYITCQFYPGGKTMQHLRAAAARGVAVQLVFNHPAAMGFAAPLHYAHMLFEHLHTPSAFFAGQLPKKAPKLHAKVLATEQSALVGSHNYVTQGVSFGTAEIALLRHDADFSRKLQAHITSEIVRLR